MSRAKRPFDFGLWFKKVSPRLLPGGEMPILTDAFWKWFGASKVVDSAGNPLLVFHATSRGAFTGRSFRVLKTEPVAYFTPDPEYAKFFGDVRLYAGYLSIQNPFELRGFDAAEISGEEFCNFFIAQNMRLPDAVETDVVRYGTEEDRAPAWWFFKSWSKEISRLLQEHGYDGVTLREDAGTKSRRHAEADSFAIFSPEQFKSIDNGGTWDADSRDMNSNPDDVRHYESNLDGAHAQKQRYLSTYAQEFGSVFSKMVLVPIEEVEVLEKLDPDNLEKIRTEIKNGETIPPVLLDTGFGPLDGNHRIAVSKELGMTHIPAIFYGDRNEVLEIVREDAKNPRGAGLGDFSEEDEDDKEPGECPDFGSMLNVGSKGMLLEDGNWITWKIDKTGSPHHDAVQEQCFKFTPPLVTATHWFDGVLSVNAASPLKAQIAVHNYYGKRGADSKIFLETDDGEWEGNFREFADYVAELEEEQEEDANA